MPDTHTRTQHTPGKWKVYEDTTYEVRDSRRRVLALYPVRWDDPISRDEREANAYLQAAAPDLLAACEAAYANLKPAYASEHLVIKMLTAAIRKARGEDA